jgi:uncharacterized protein YutE (UPF0331/DUF86 family)
MSESPTYKFRLQPRDIFAPIATLSGLLIAAVGFLRASSLSGQLTETITTLILIVLLFLVVTAASASIYAYSGKEMYWKFTLFFYPISWIAFGLGIGFMFAVIASGRTVFPVFKLPPYFLFAIAVLLLILVASIDAFLVARRLTKKSIDAAKKELNPHLLNEETTKKSTSRTRPDDLKMEFIRNFIEIEKSLRELASNRIVEESTGGRSLKKLSEKLFRASILDRDYAATLNFLMKIRNGIVHGEIVPPSAVKEAYELSNVLKKELSEDITRMKSL